MPKAADLTGRTFGKLYVVGPTELRGLRAWECRCSCGAVVTLVTTRLTRPSGGVAACPGCSGARVRTVVDRDCSVCGSPFQGDPKAMFCSSGCRKARRRGLQAGADHLPPPTRACEVCGAPFHFTHNRRTCSAACLKERRRRRALEGYRRRVERDPELAKKMGRRRREKALADPEYAARVRAWDRKKYRRHAARMASDPEYAARHREWHRAHYAARAEAIQERRRHRLMTLSDDELAELAERVRRYGREHRRRRRADPIKRDRDLAVVGEWRRRRDAGLFHVQVSQLLAEAAARLDDPARIKPCVECGRPVVGRRASAVTCSGGCAEARRVRQVVASRERARRLPADRVCPICSTPIDPRTCRITCSEPCRAERRRLQNLQYKGKET